MNVWRESHKADRVGCSLADRHYSRRKPGAPQFMPPGQTIVLVSVCGRAVFGWWRPHPRSGIRAMNGLDGWTCTIFRNEGAGLSSALILEAETFVNDCGPSGFITYVDTRKVRSANPGYCFKAAGYRSIGWARDGHKRLLSKPFGARGIAEWSGYAWKHAC